MKSSRLEAFSDGVIAILITIMVLELRVPDGVELEALRPLIPVLLMYLLSFVFLGIYWNNHHHLLYATERINGKVLWANQHLLFWLSLVPFTTRWMGGSEAAPVPTAVYGVVLLMSALAYTILQSAIIHMPGTNFKLEAAVGKDLKGRLSLLAYLVAIPLAFVQSWFSIAVYVLVALIWLVPDRRIESTMK
jgi:uncharacterized membrane protein